MGPILVSGIALCLVLYAVLFYFVFKDAEEDRLRGPHEIQYEIKEYPEWDRFVWKVWSSECPSISLSGEAVLRPTAVRHARRAIREVRDEIVFGKMDEESGEVWL